MISQKKPSAVMQFSGGLGNQIFQYHAGYLFSSLHKLDLKLDFSRLQTDRTIKSRSRSGMTQLGLRGLRIPNGEILKSNIFSRILGSNALYRMTPFESQSGLHDFVQDNEMGQYLTAGDLENREIYPRVNRISGYFQSLDIVRSAIKLGSIAKLEPLNETTKFKSIKNQINQNNDLAVHVRLTDYLKQSNVSLVSTDYYVRAIDVARKNGFTGRIWFFSDDIDLCRTILKLDSCDEKVLISQFDLDDVETLVILSSFKFLIISNSTFSYLAGFYSSADTKVIAPHPWFHGKSKDVEQSFPYQWETISYRLLSAQ